MTRVLLLAAEKALVQVHLGFLSDLRRRFSEALALYSRATLRLQVRLLILPTNLLLLRPSPHLLARA